mgnify:CR=1 FL=1|jgi:hypothetical protein
MKLNLFKPKNRKKETSVVKKNHKTIADMESNGVYFSEDAIKSFEEKRQELICKYSGLPNVSSYQ